MVNTRIFLVGVAALCITALTEGAVVDLHDNHIEGFDQYVAGAINQVDSVGTLNINNQNQLNALVRLALKNDYVSPSATELSSVTSTVEEYPSASASASPSASPSASASASFSVSSNIKKILSEQASITKQSDEHGLNSSTGIIVDVLWPLAFNTICKSLSDISEDLGHILDRYTGPNGMECTNEQRNIINSPQGCSNADGATNFVTQLLWPLAFQGIIDTTKRIDAQTQCLRKFLS